MRGVIVQGCYRGALLKRQPGAGHQGYRVGGRPAIAAVKQRLPGNGDADGAITQLMLGGAVRICQSCHVQASRHSCQSMVKPRSACGQFASAASCMSTGCCAGWQ